MTSRNETDYRRLTVAELRDQLKGWNDSDEITFGSTLAGVPLVFYRFKRRGEYLLQIELNEAEET